MILNRKILILAAALAATIAPARATVTIDIQAENLLQGGLSSSSAAGGALVLLVADTTGGGFGALDSGPITVGSLINQGGNNLVVGQFSITAGSFLTNFQPVLNASNSSFVLSGAWDAGDPLAIYWIPTETTSNTGVGSGVAYGKYTDAVGLGISDAWTTPSDGGTRTLVLSTNGLNFDNNVANAAASAGYASQLTVPEPSTYALLGGAIALTFAALRRRKTSPTPVA